MKQSVEKIKNKYYSPTPRKWRVIGDNLLVISQVLAASSILLNFYPTLGVVVSVLGVIGKILTNLKF